jgi:hypothetical protein
MRPFEATAFVFLAVTVAVSACSDSDIEGDATGECEDGADNDRDGLFDCDDPDCSGAPSCKDQSEGGGGTGGQGGQGGGVTRWQKLAAAGVHNCGLVEDDTIRCWGNDAQGQSSPPTGDFVDVKVSFYHSCGLGTDGELRCWGCKGDRDYGQCDVPPDLGEVQHFDTGTYETCAVTPNGQARCWGCVSTDHEQCDPPGSTFEAITAGSIHVCGLVAGTALCWGSDDFEQSSPTPGTYTQISAGTWHTCGLREDGGINCWGCVSTAGAIADFGQCDAPSGSFQQVAAGVYQTCGVKMDGTVVCWGCIGEDAGQDTDTGQCSPPGDAFEAIAVGKYHGCGLRSDATITCWGDNAFDQLVVP